jgi:hypothetical protein
MQGMLGTHRRLGRTIGLPVAALAALLAMTSIASGQYERPDPWDAAVRELRAATRFSPDGTHHALLLALRQLKDPALKPFFHSLVQGEHWSIQVDGIIGIAELSPARRVDPFLLAQLKGEEDRSTAIAAAVGLDLVGPEEATAMLAWDDLPPRDQVLLLLTIHRRGGTPDAARLARLAQHRNDQVAGLASFLLAEGGSAQGRAAVDAFRARFAALPSRDRNALLTAMSAPISEFDLASAAGFLADTLHDATLPTEVRMLVLATLLKIAPEPGYAAWRRTVEADPSQASRVRLALMLLAVDTILPRTPADPLRKGSTQIDPLLAALADAIDAVASGSDAVPALRTLIATRHRPSLTAILDAVPRLPEAQRAQVLGAIADLLSLPGRRELPPALVEVCVAALARLATLDPQAIATRLDEAVAASRRDEDLQELLVLALASAGTPEAAAIAERHRDTVSRRASSIALIMVARHATSLDAQRLKELSVIASGGGRVDRPFQAQAAWLYAKHAGRADQAITAALAPR